MITTQTGNDDKCGMRNANLSRDPRDNDIAILLNYDVVGS